MTALGVFGRGVTGLGVFGLGVTGVGTFGLGVTTLGVVGLGVVGLGVVGLDVTGLCARASPGVEIEIKVPMSTSPSVARSILCICVMSFLPFTSAFSRLSIVRSSHHSPSISFYDGPRR